MTKPKRKPRNSFSAALDAAAKRYAKATKEREVAVQKLDALDKELPALRETIVALQKQLGRKSIDPDPVADTNGTRRSEVQRRLQESIDKSDLTKLVGPQDLTGMGSIPPKSSAPQAVVNESETLPDVEGTEVLP